MKYLAFQLRIDCRLTGDEPFLLLLITSPTQSVRKPLVCGIVALLVAVAIVPSLQPVTFAQNEPSAGNSSGGTPTELKTYTDPQGFFSLQYPADWTEEYKQPETRFDSPKTVFSPGQ
jgi:hypothetical protein